MLAALSTIQGAATALDATDAVCLTGRGVAARTSHRTATPLAQQAASRLRTITGAVAVYRAALVSLGGASVAVTGPARDALRHAVTVGKAEASAVTAFRDVASTVWPDYMRLDAAESTWITRAVTPWYRSDKEGKDAYIVLVEDQRAALNASRGRLGAAVQALRGPVDAQTAALAQADQALSAVRDAG